MCFSLTSDPEHRAADANNKAAQQIRPKALAEFLPRARTSFSTRWSERHRQVDYRSDVLTLNVEHPVYRRNRPNVLEQAEKQTAAADAIYVASGQDLMVRVAERYFGILEAEDELSFAQATLDAFRQQLALSRQRFAAGLLATTDVEEAKAGFDLAIAQFIAAENALDIARESLRETTGAYPKELKALGEMDLAMPEPADIDQWTAIALGQNARLLAAVHASEVARREIERIQADRFPTMDAVGSLGLHDSESRNGDNWQAFVGLRLNVPLYTGGLILSRTTESRHHYMAALEELERIRREVQRETRSAYRNLESGISRVRALQQSVRSSEAAADQIEAGFNVGTRSTVDVLDAQRDLFRARRDLSEARYRYVLDLLRLERAAGTLSEDHMRLISGWLH